MGVIADEFEQTTELLVHRFQHDPDCRAIIMSNAGSTGLNLQAANTVINVDLPWNPTRLEQRIGRIKRFGHVPFHELLAMVNDVDGIDRLTRVLYPEDPKRTPVAPRTRKAAAMAVWYLDAPAALAARGCQVTVVRNSLRIRSSKR